MIGMFRSSNGTKGHAIIVETAKMFSLASAWEFARLEYVALLFPTMRETTENKKIGRLTIYSKDDLLESGM